MVIRRFGRSKPEFCGADPVLGFAHFGIRQADDGQTGQAIRQVNFDADGGRLHAGQRPAAHDCKTHGDPVGVKTCRW
jgi:hypothetical protein